ncbi:MAG: DUF4276 family protein [Acidobacteriota bacterium]|jgi:hypothetical protein
MMESYGVIVEGPYEEGVYEEFIRKICPEARNIRFRTAGGCSQVMKRFPTLLQSLEHVTDQGGPVEKALVTRDADCKDPAIIEAKMQESVSRRVFSFSKGVGYHAVRQETETWLLADPEAINRVAASRGGKVVPRVPDQLENLQDPKGTFKEVLSRSGLNYTAQVCREIAKETDLTKLRIRCPSFATFEQKVIDP